MAGVNVFEQIEQQRRLTGQGRVLSSPFQVLVRMVTNLLKCRHEFQYQTPAGNAVFLFNSPETFLHHAFIQSRLIGW